MTIDIIEIPGGIIRPFEYRQWALMVDDQLMLLDVDYQFLLGIKTELEVL